MDKLLTGWLLVLAVTVTSEAAPQFQPLYLGYVSPFEFLRGLQASAGQFGYPPFRSKRSAMGPMNYNNHYQSPTHSNAHYNPMSSFGHNDNFGYDPYNMFSSFPTMKFPAMPKFPDMKFPSMPKFQFPSYSFPQPIMPSSNFFSSVFKPFRPFTTPTPTVHHPFGNDFMKMMGFHGNHANTYNNNNNNNYNNNQHSGNNGKGNNYEMSYSNSYSMNMDYTNGQGHMVTQDSSYMNDNGKVYQHTGPHQHYTSFGNGKFMPDNTYPKH